ncbi:alpha/beta hydrolase family protein [Parahaliea mediterranea]|uniref:alpha/beta hydrolase family protein n=1 Tax=Parahaliea mediterranea TaxID=651086 RepID=UPI000E2FB0B2|nr:alpha/beta fold hydrolase [Parahaliea mediterranea]
MWVDGLGFRHRVFSRVKDAEPRLLRVYLGGDGRAFLNPTTVAADPTPGEHLGLSLMLADPGNALYLARPCYYQPTLDANCQPALWSEQRYGATVLASLERALATLLAQYPGASVHLVGYSGGGVLALQLARRSARVRQVVTVAAPLDTDAWTRHHHYTALPGPQNPAHMAEPWPVGLVQVHLAGADDSNVPPALNQRFAAQLASSGATARFYVLPGFDHRCCWHQQWPALLNDYRL